MFRRCRSDFSTELDKLLYVKVAVLKQNERRGVRRLQQSRVLVVEIRFPLAVDTRDGFVGVSERRLYGDSI